VHYHKLIRLQSLVNNYSYNYNNDSSLTETTLNNSDSVIIPFCNSTKQQEDILLPLMRTNTNTNAACINDLQSSKKFKNINMFTENFDHINFKTDSLRFPLSPKKQHPILDS
jgi:hypothetical protein